MVLERKDTTVYLSQQQLAIWANTIATKSVRQSRDTQNKAERLRYYLKAMEHEYFLTDEEIVNILTCMEQLAEITDWPTAPVLTEPTQPTIGDIPGPTGPAGADGADGSDADIDVLSGDAIINVVETTPGGVKTFTITYEPYTPPGVLFSIDTSIFPNAGSLIQEDGATLASVIVSTTLTKGKDDIVTSEFVTPSAMDVDYQASLDLPSINGGSPQLIQTTQSSVTATTSYNVDTDDGTTVVSKVSTVTFVIPFLTGSSATQLIQTTAYANLSKVIEQQGDKIVTFNGTDEYFYFIYPATYPDLSVIRDGNGFDVTSAFIKTTENIDMLSGTESMTMYETLLTDIVNQDYSFEF